MVAGRGRRTILNFLSSFGLTIVTFTTAMISSRLVLSKIGDERFGAFRSLFELFGYLNLVDAGLSTSLRPLLAQSLSSENLVETRRLFQMARITFLGGAGLAIFIGIGMTACIPGIIPVASAAQADLRLASLIFTFGLLNIGFGPARSLCESMQRSYFINLSLIAQSLCITFTTMLLCTRFPQWGITAQAGSIVFWVFLFNSLLNLAVRKYRKTWPAAGPVAEKSGGGTLSRSLWRNSRDSFILMMAGRATLQSNSLMLGLFVGQSEVTQLYATQRLFDVVQTQLFAVGHASWASLAEIFHKNHLELFRRRVTQLIRLIFVMAVATLIPVYHFNGPFVTLWVGQGRYGGSLTSAIMLANVLALAFTVFSTWCLTGTGHLNSIMRLTIVTSSLDILASLVFTRQFGLNGPILGSCCVFYLCTIPWHARLLGQHFQIPGRRLATAILGPCLLGLPYSLMVFGLRQWSLPVGQWSALALLMGLPTLLYLLVAGTLLLEPEDQQTLWRKLRIRS